MVRGEGDGRMIVAGIGCRPGISADSVVELVAQMQQQAGVSANVLAIPAFRQEEPGLAEAAERLSLPVRVLDLEILRSRQGECVSVSDAARKAHGLASVAEACALAGAGKGSILLAPREKGRDVTCALAKRLVRTGDES
ncbi:cobalamin biosynthesis protein [Acetobacter estunensis]|uniref:cobalamin biosynthesis protein n=1 Tax=Acetobacter estunensis TaxID=104097 RepID=UPI001C2D509B|nr:cobalamin biosynthesis protein [Acetobacter estunensis]MBV1837758.1 cobalamin biosynthesis protein [Acetobacter estunensis]